MSKSKLILLSFIFSSFNVFGQFNTVVKKMEIPEIVPELASQENRVIFETQKEKVFINDNLAEERKELLNRRKFFSLPIDTIIINSPYGKRKDPINGKIKVHNGIDLKAYNDYIYSVMPGKVVKVSKNKGYGNYIEVEHGDFKSIYAHLQNVLVNSKQTIEAGQPIGISGNTGRSTGEHLHFEIKYKGKTIDPTPLLEYITDVIYLAKIEIVKQINAELKKANNK